MFGLDGLEIITELPVNLTIGISALFVCTLFVSKKVEEKITSKPNFAFITGIISLFFILIIGTFWGSTVGFLQFGLLELDNDYNFSNAIFDYYFKPFFWIFLMGAIPVLISGGLMGIIIKRKLKSKTATNR